MHAAWWVALALAILLAGVVTWVLTRPSPSSVIAPSQAQLPLRLSADIDLSKIAMHDSLQDKRNSDSGSPVQSVSDPQIARANVPPTAEPASSAAKEKAEEKSLSALSSSKTASLPAQTSTQREVSASKAMEASVSTPQPTETPKTIDVVAAVAAQKQVRELTVQQRAENEYRKATMQIQQGKQDEAIATLEQALQLDGHHTAARQALISLLLDVKRQDEAMGKAREGLRLDNAQPGLAMILARLQLEKGDLKPAIETLERSHAHAAEKSDYQSFLAALLQRDNRNKEAAELYMRILQRAPQNGVWWMGLGISLQAESRFSEAQEAFSRARASANLSPELMAFVESRLKQLQR
jgi:MSHA biogenesis protein MshN